MVPVSSACKVCEVSKLVVSTDKFSEKYNYIYIKYIYNITYIYIIHFFQSLMYILYLLENIRFVADVVALFVNKKDLSFSTLIF